MKLDKKLLAALIAAPLLFGSNSAIAMEGMEGIEVPDTKATSPAIKSVVKEGDEESGDEKSGDEVSGEEVIDESGDEKSGEEVIDESGDEKSSQGSQEIIAEPKDKDEPVIKSITGSKIDLEGGVILKEGQVIAEEEEINKMKEYLNKAAKKVNTLKETIEMLKEDKVNLNEELGSTKIELTDSKEKFLNAEKNVTYFLTSFAKQMGLKDLTFINAILNETPSRKDMANLINANFDVLTNFGKQQALKSMKKASPVAKKSPPLINYTLFDDTEVVDSNDESSEARKPKTKVSKTKPKQKKKVFKNQKTNLHLL